uniref:Threonylcarbamoyl-AMP synthase n=1 Tax=Dunaliella tertiolecta TaxID=3047 RepID=A0A7S3QMC8_DUNTE|mmetsp:Transcript_28074/g.75833  ORF Transcript_28074/g.75833 Transcript_28074/m.75833 type:complete len:276 (+) Transcript_28074:82-909(+)|eukprot:CAMPEP_0202352938 /NCGR_PEP_ID=MMETSP1126-20121109/8917_1 /ASSEMBLY_ACC=CAM_ASM_000457 /TAXON_ID=3047 /ORGANISM="Dunaliella tertiolecta, Strain CCMP1320" /LENGTH=275 /DNA_ID=CAMNT_0048945223 /DNA_START=23 /DNA_END=850 /DNA_ORIENTATION=-
MSALQGFVPACLPAAPLRHSACRRGTTHITQAVRQYKRVKYSGLQQGGREEPEVISCEPDGSDAWRVSRACEIIKEGGVGIIPTDTFPALVVDLQNRDAVLKLYNAKELDTKRPLSILCKNFHEVSTYTTGFPESVVPGQPDWFGVMRKILPGPYTIILPASKLLPRQCVDFLKARTKTRKSVGVRIPDDKVCLAVLEGLDNPLLCTSAHVPDQLAPDTETPDLGSMLTAYAGKGVDFIVDVGPRVATQSTIIDMTGNVPEVLRVGKGDASYFQQ